MTGAPRTRAYIGLGANLGDAAGTLAAAVHALAAMPGVNLRGVSRLYATEPVGVIDQPEFRNAVVALDVPSGPDPETGATALLVALKRLEAAFGRQVRGRWGPRELDLDLLVFGRANLAIDRPSEGRSIDSANDPARAARLLEVPHPEMRARLFVLAPMADLAAGLVPAGWGESVATARGRREQAEGPDTVRPIAAWDSAAGGWRL
jgi:2-amino-4-hydroxy-6-hydroxymethyldihydropteridine diphosphokinase